MIKGNITKVVYIHFYGEKFPDDPNAKIQRLKCRDDKGLVGRFLKWCGENEIYTAISAGYSGGGGHAGGYYPEDAEKILEWLDKEKVELVEFVKESV